MVNTRLRKRNLPWILLFSVTGFLCICSLYGIYDYAYPSRNLKEIIQNEPCNGSLGRTMEENIEKIKSYPFQAADKYIMDLTPSTKPEIIWKGPGTSDIELPAIVSGASSNHMHEVVRMFATLNKVVRPAYPAIRVHFFDLGLTTDERNKVQGICNCKIHSFPFERFPPHVKRLNSYCWKPLIVAMMLQTYQFVLWMDSSIQFQTSDLDSLFLKAKEKGVMAKYDGFLLASHTNEDTYSYLHEIPCVFRNSREFSASLLLFHGGNHIIKNYVIKPWVACALTEDCQRTKHPEWKLLHCRTHEHYHACHRYDQAVFGLLMYRLFSENYLDFDIGGSVANWCRDYQCQWPWE